MLSLFVRAPKVLENVALRAVTSADNEGFKFGEVFDSVIAAAVDVNQAGTAPVRYEVVACGAVDGYVNGVVAADNVVTGACVD